MANQIDEGFTFNDEFITNRRGIKSYTCRWLPSDQEPKALVFLCHGYAMECSISMQGTGTRLAKAGFAVYGMDYEGHGKTEGLQGYVPDFNAVVEDCSEYFSSICERAENKKKKRFLLGESMGGAVALLVHRREPDYWNGAVLVAPMCKIADEIRPHPIVISVLVQLCKVIPTWKIVPTKDIIDSAFKDPQYRTKVRNNKYCYTGKPRLKTAYELSVVCTKIEKELTEVSLPFIIVHGSDDIVTDPSISHLLYETAASTDKTYKLYPKMWHALTSGEPPENIDRVFSDIVEWLDERAKTHGDAASEVEKKAMHDPRYPALHGKD